MKKKLLSVCFALALMIGLLPSQAFAIDADDPQLESFLESIDWELQDYEDYLADFDLGLDDFDDPAYLGTPLTEEGLEEIYDTYDLTYDELNDLLYEEEGLLEEDEEFPDSIWYMFIEDIEFSLDLIMNDPLTALDEDLSEENLEAVAEEYDFGSIEELEELFNLYEDSINNYTTLFEIENATEIYVAMEDGSGLDDEMWEENDDVSEDDDFWEDNTDLSLDMLDTSILSDEPIFDIYAMITVMFLEATLDFK
ncbi:processed acidic surface protein [Oceanobacillus sojae]|uniref:processed acidic surface protein n=1 Tax=Oceanobacillus sojae TaxID=582851 RepID=UPI0009886ACC|nr:processed acidic surface protein [Oceanobacillus sojae]